MTEKINLLIYLQLKCQIFLKFIVAVDFLIQMVHGNNASKIKQMFSIFTF